MKDEYTYVPDKFASRWKEGDWVVELVKDGYYPASQVEKWTVTIRADYQSIMRQRKYYDEMDALHAFKAAITITETMIGRMAFGVPFDDLTLPQPKVG